MSNNTESEAGKVNKLISFFDQKGDQVSFRTDWKVKTCGVTEKYLAQFCDPSLKSKQNEPSHSQTTIHTQGSSLKKGDFPPILDVDNGLEIMESQIHEIEEYTLKEIDDNYRQEAEIDESRNISHASVSENKDEDEDETSLSNIQKLEENVALKCRYKATKETINQQDLDTIVDVGPQDATKPEANPIPTIISFEFFNPSDDAKVIQNALKDGSRKYHILVEILTARTYLQRREISDVYYEIFGKSFTKTLKDQLTGDFERIMVALVSTKYDFYAKELRKAMKGMGTNEDRLIELLCCHDNNITKKIKMSYQKICKCSLLDDIRAETSGRFREILVRLLSENKHEPDDYSVQDIANQLRRTVSDDEVSKDLISNILVDYSRPFLFCVFVTYNQRSGKDFAGVIEDAFEGDCRKALLTIYKSVTNIHEYFAARINASFVGLGTKEDTLTEIAVGRCEVDLKNIVDVYNAKYCTPLYDMIKNETSGNFRLSILALFGDPSINEQYRLMEEAYGEHGLKCETEVYTQRTDKECEMVESVNHRHGNEFQRTIYPNESEEQHRVDDQNQDAEDEKYQRSLENGIHQVEQVNVEDESLTNQSINSDVIVVSPSIEAVCNDQFDGQTSSKYEISSDDVSVQKDTILYSEITPMIRDEHSINDDESFIPNDPTAIVKKSSVSEVEVDNINNQFEEDKKIASIYEIHLPSHITGLELIPTIICAKRFDIMESSTILSHALDGLKTKETIIVDILTKMSYIERNAIITEFKNKDKNLEHLLKKELCGYFQDTILALMGPPLTFITKELHKALGAFTVREEILMEIICSASETELKNIKAKYLELYDQPITSALSDVLTGPLKDLILQLLIKDRRHCKDVASLYAYVADLRRNSNLSQEKIIDLMTSYKCDALFGLFYLFEIILESQFGNVIGDVCTGINRVALLIRYKSIMNRDAFYADILHQAMRGYGTNEAALIRVIVGRCEIDLQNIKSEYVKNFDREVTDIVQSETSGHFRDALVSLLKGNENPKCEFQQQNSVIIYDDESLVADTRTSLRDAGGFLASSRERVGIEIINEDVPKPEDDLQLIISQSTTPYNPPCIYSEAELSPTVHEALSFSPQHEGHDLLRNLSDKSISSVLTTITKVNFVQRQQLVNYVQEHFEKNIIEELRKYLSDQCIVLISYLTFPRCEILAHEIKKSISGSEMSSKTVLEILATRDQEHNKCVSNCYEKLFNISLIEDIKANTIGQYQEILLELIETPTMNPKINCVTLARQFAEMGSTVCANSDDHPTLNENFLVKLLTSFSHQFLYDLFYAYDFLTNLPFTSVINQLSVGDVRMALTEIHDWIYKRDYFAAKIHAEEMEHALTRILATRCELDLEKIKDHFESSYDTSLLEYCSGITDDYYKMVVFSIINGNNGYCFENTNALIEFDGNVQEKHEAQVHFKDDGTNEATTPENLNCHIANISQLDDINCPGQNDDEAQLLQKPTKNVQFMSDLNIPAYLIGSRISYVTKTDTPFDATEDATASKKALKGLVVDEKSIIEIFSKRSVSQRMQICIKYQELYGKALVTKLKKRLSGDFENLLVALITPIHAFMAKEVHRTVKGLGTDEKSLAEIICLQDEDSLKAICSGYKNLFDCSLPHAVASDTSGGAKQIFGLILSEKRFDQNIDPYDVAEKFCQRDINIDEVVDIMGRHKFLFLFKFFHFYEKLTGYSFADYIKKIARGDTKITLLTIYHGITARQSFLAERLHSALKSHNTKESTVSRIIISRRDVDLEEIKVIYEEIYQTPLNKVIKAATSGSYRKLLLSLL